MEILGRIEITVGPDILRSENTLSAAQKDMVRRLILTTMHRGNWLKKALTRVLEEEMFHTSRELGPEARAQVEELLHGIWISVGTPLDPDDADSAHWLLSNIADNLRGCEGCDLSSALLRHKIGMVYDLVTGYLTAAKKEAP